jgi:Ca-activated chloride channel homolog
MRVSASRHRGLLFLVVLCCVLEGRAQNGGNRDDSKPEFRLDLRVDEVVLTFHATDAHGLPVNDIKREEIKLWDNGVAPRRIVAFDSLLDRPMRVGFLLDTSESMERTLAASKGIAERFAGRVFRQKSDQGFVMAFGYGLGVSVPWTNNSAVLAQGIRNVREGGMNPLGGTALIDAVFRACFSEFGHADRTATANVLLIFSDGEDTASHTSMDEALGACQQTNTAIYAFRVPAEPNRYSTGAKTLEELAARSGGRVFPADDSDETIWNDLSTIESEARNEYRLIYDPAQLKHDGRFHEIEIQPPDRVSRVEVRSGYYAPKR